VLAPANSMKFSISVTGWPFSSTANTLAVNMEIKSAGNGPLVNGTRQRFDIAEKGGGGFIDFASTAMIDGVSQAIDVEVSSNNKQKRAIQIVFPNFVRSAVYDPVTALGSPSMAGNAFPAYAIALIVVAVIGVIAGVGFYCFRAKEGKQDGFRALLA